MVKSGDLSRVKVREFVGLYSGNTKMVWPNYFSNGKYYFIVSSDDIEVVHGFPIDTHSIT